MLYTWSSIYHSQIKEGNDYNKLRPVISIWILNENLFDNVDDFHLPFLLYNQRNNLVFSQEMAIHILQLPKWQPHKIKTEKERWVYLFKEGENVNVDDPSKILYTDEMRQAMSVLNRFSENKDNYLLYQSRLDAILLNNTYINDIAKAKKEMEIAIKKAEAEKRNAEQERKEKEQKTEEIKQIQAKLDSLILQLKEKGMEDIISEISNTK
ncbi:MAG: Rpn family recombination-promoting nuclease/putative transposase [Thiomargarita sp.]|nr:Rpn family recombination-promoting nuclease/putative transposase [Thiomargarita sp.]